jgi:hypothetical protein
MTVTLTTTYRPQGELPRLRRFLPELHALYETIIIVTSPGLEQADLDALDALPGVIHHQTDRFGVARSACLRLGLEQSTAGTLHYCDMDRMIRWVERKPESLKATVTAIQGPDAVMIGRTPADFETHPKALADTERIIFDITEYLLGQRLDVASGSKAFSRQAAEFIVGLDDDQEQGLGTDMVWPVLLHRAGFELTALTVQGLDWETADRFQPQAANATRQQAEAAAYDADPSRWEFRVNVAREIIQAGLAAMTKSIG